MREPPSLLSSIVSSGETRILGKFYHFLLEIFVAQFCIRLMLVLALEYDYIDLRIKLKELLQTRDLDVAIAIGGNNSVVLLLQDQLNSVRERVNWLSPLQPELMLSSVFVIGTFVGPIVPFHYVDLLTDKYSNLGKDFLFRILRDETLGKQQISEELDNFICELKASNANYAAILINLRIRIRQLHNDNGAQKCESTVRARWNSNIELPKGLPGASSQAKTSTIALASLEKAKLSKRLLSERLSHLSNYHSIEKQLVIIESEYRQLELLSTDKSTIWPSNRNEHWLNLIKSTWLRYVLIGLLFWNLVVVQIMPNFFYWLNREIATRQSFKKRPPSVVRGLGYFERSVILFKVGDWVVLPIVNMFITQMDLLQLMATFRLKVDKYLATTIKSKRELALNTSSSGSNESWKFAIECNKLAIEAYISLRYIMIQLESMKPNVEFLTHKSLFTIILISLPVLHALNKTTEMYPFEELMLESLGIMIFVCGNATLIMFATLNAYSMRIIKNIWSVLHCSTTSFSRDDVHGGAGGDTHQMVATPSGVNTNAKFQFERRALSETLDYRNSIISPHLLLLWHRLIAGEQSHLIQLFTYHLFGSIPLNFKELIVLNSRVLFVFMFIIFYKDYYDIGL